MSYYARFIKVCKLEFRLDTRIYLEDGYHREEDGVCVAAIVGKNPGSACSIKVDSWEHLVLAGDKMLPSVRNRFIEGYRLSGKQIPKNAFVRVWNLFYLCNKELDLAIAAHGKIPSKAPTCFSEKDIPRIVWFAWGNSDARLNSFKARFQSFNITNAFYFDKNLKRIFTRIPSQEDFAKHPQGLFKTPIVTHLASIL